MPNTQQPEFQDSRQMAPPGSAAMGHAWDGIDRRTVTMVRETEHSGPQPRGVKFDATINLGHILTFVGFVVAGFTAWSTLDKRVTVIEERAQLQAMVDRNQDANMSNNMQAIKETLTEIKVQIHRLSDRQDRGRP